MPSLALTLRRWQGAGRKVHIPFRNLDELVDFRTGQLAVLAGAAGSGKSTLSANWAWRSQQPVVYLAQEDPFSTIQTMVALATNRAKHEVTPDDVLHWANHLDDLGKRQELDFVTGAQTVQALEARIIALTEWLMQPPALIIIDSLFDIKVEGTNYMETSFYAQVLPELKQMAIRQDVGILAQHHVVRGGPQGLGIEPLKLNSAMFGGEKEAAHVWGVYHREDSRQMYVQVLKQRNGKADPGGNLRVTFDWNASRGVLHSY